MASYKGNIGFVEMVKFTEVATPQEQDQMDRAIAQENWEAFKGLINAVLGTDLK